MRKLLLAAAATAALAAPAAARDGSGYVGIEGGLLLPRDMNGDAYVDNVRTFGNTFDFNDGGAFDVNLKRGWDIDAVAGYDFGMFRLEGELGWKRAKRDGFNPDSAFLTSLNSGLNGTTYDSDDFDDTDGKVSVKSAMVNALVDFGADDGLSFYAGAGAGRAWGKALNDSDSAWAFQGILGARTAISENIDLGLKYRYFRTGRMGFVGGPLTFAGNNGVGGAGAYSTVTPAISDRFRSHSLLATLTFNFGAAEAAPVAVMAPPPPPPPAPATQTCPDGSVILATDMCPAPPPPPPPAPAGERG